jgi:HEAT repeat protein
MGITNSDHKIRFTSAKILAAISEQSYLEEIIRPLVLRAMADPHPHVRATAIKAFRNLGHVRDSAKLIKLLNDADERVRANVVETLSQFWNKKTNKAIRHMANDPSPRVKANTAIIMAKRGTKEGLKLIRKLLNSEDPALKIAGNYALQAVGGRLR